MPSLPSRIASVRARIADAAIRSGRHPDDIRLLAVSKTRPAADVRSAHHAGLRDFGENYLQEALEKQQALGDLDIVWHFIGGLQSNKTAAVARSFQWVHSLSSLKHARRLDAQRPPEMPAMEVCLQVNICNETSKGGVPPDELAPLAREVLALPRLRLRGLMALPAPASDFGRQREVFARVRTLSEQLGKDGIDLDTLSMGMSGDLEAAIAEGATIVRIGTALFGPRK